MLLRNGPVNTFEGNIYFAGDGTMYVSYLFSLLLIDCEFNRKSLVLPPNYMRKTINSLVLRYWMMYKKREWFALIRQHSCNALMIEMGNENIVHCWFWSPKYGDLILKSLKFGNLAHLCWYISYHHSTAKLEGWRYLCYT